MGICTVSELNNRIKRLLTNDPKIRDVWVRGEISNLTKHISGHYYFTIKDRNSQLNCVSFRSTNRTLKFEPETSMKVLVFGSIDVYTVRGQYQLRVYDIRPDGIGELYKSFEQLKKKLEKEGLFDKSYKKCIPKYPTKIGVVTSPTGAVIHDILNVVKRRCPVNILIAPALVQGEQSVQSIAASIEMLNQTDVDVIIVSRGGGSLEDLWSFNEEVVAKAIFNSTIPIISAVGHETDYTIADFTADMRASTPSAAAELVVPNRIEIRRHIESLSIRMEQAAIHNISKKTAHLSHLQKQIEPDRLIDLLRQNQQRVDEMISRMEYSIKNILNMKRSLLKICAGQLDAISPLKTIERGYSITIIVDNRKIVGNISDVKKGDGLEIIVKDGTIECSVDDINENK